VTSHNFRKSVATILDDAGHSGRQLADQIGHSQVSMAQNFYLARKVAKSASCSGHRAVPESGAQEANVRRRKGWVKDGRRLPTRHRHRR
jgi:integrase